MGKAKTRVHYQVCIAGTSYLSPDGYSKYNRNLMAFYEGKREASYSLVDAMAHRLEYIKRMIESEYTNPNPADIWIEKVITTTERINVG